MEREVFIFCSVVVSLRQQFMRSNAHKENIKTYIVDDHGISH